MVVVVVATANTEATKPEAPELDDLIPFQTK